jgi:hypothetical protein
LIGFEPTAKEETMRSSFQFAMLATLLVGSGTLAAVGANAQIRPSTTGGIRAPLVTSKFLESTAYTWEGRNYCWYDDGWQGPGWYACNYGPWVSGLWWGGGYGWHSWHGGHSHDWYEHHGHYEHHDHNDHHHNDHHAHNEHHDHHNGNGHHNGGGHHDGNGHNNGGGHHGGKHHGGKKK